MSKFFSFMTKSLSKYIMLTLNHINTTYITKTHVYSFTSLALITKYRIDNLKSLPRDLAVKYPAMQFEGYPVSSLKAGRFISYNWQQENLKFILKLVSSRYK